MTDKINIDEIVEVITARVSEKLKELGIAPDAAGRVIQCVLSDDACTYCGQCIVKKPDAVNNIVSIGAARIGAGPGISARVDKGLAGMIDHTLLKPGATREDLTKICREAKEFGFATVCVNAGNIPLVARELRGTSVKPIAVVGFPLGATTTEAKVFEAKEAIRAGAKEIDMVINIGALKTKDYQTVYEDILRVVEVSRPYKTKVIIEASELDHDEKVIACALSKAAGAAFVKTSTGFAKGGAKVEDIQLMRKIVGTDMEIKASGGIRTREDAEAMIKAGATRIGASASVEIVTGKKIKVGNY